MNIAMYHPSDINNHGGVETHIRCLARELTAMGHRVDLFCPIDPRQNETHYGQPRFLPSRLRSEKYHIIHTHAGDIAPWALLRYQLTRHPAQRHVHTTHNVGFEYLVNCRTPLNWRCYTATVQEWYWSAYADQVIAVSRSAARWAIRRFHIPSHKVTVIPNGSAPVEPDPDLRRRLRQQLGLTDRDFAGIFVGRGYDRVKGTADITAAFEQLHRRFPSLKLIALPGTGFENAPWLIKTGLIGHNRVYQYYQAADFFINASFSEGLPLTLVEAMAAPLPVIAAAVGGIPDIVTHGQNGLLIAQNRQNIADLIQILIKNPALRSRLTRGARQTAATLTWRKIAEQTLKIYEKTVQATSQASQPISL